MRCSGESSAPHDKGSFETGSDVMKSTKEEEKAKGREIILKQKNNHHPRISILAQLPESKIDFQIKTYLLQDFIVTENAAVVLRKIMLAISTVVFNVELFSIMLKSHSAEHLLGMTLLS